MESLILDLLARAMLSRDEVIALVAIDARIEIAADRGEGDDLHDRALALLSAIRTSLATDTGG